MTKICRVKNANREVRYSVKRAVKAGWRHIKETQFGWQRCKRSLLILSEDLRLDLLAYRRANYQNIRECQPITILLIESIQDFA